MFKMSEKPKTVLASRNLIKEFVDMEAAPYDRPLSERRMQVYERILKAGLFRPVVWASAVCYETSMTYRVNGKHTSLMLSLQPTLPDFYVTIERWICEKLSDVSQLYSTYDSSLSSRTTGDINMSFAATMPELKEVPARLVNLTVTAASLVKWDDTTRLKVSPAEKAEELMDRGHFVKWLQDVVKTTAMDRNGLSKHLMRSPVVWAMMATYDRAPHVAKEFWIKVRDESAPERGDPTRALARFLIRAVLGVAKKNIDKKNIATQTEVYVRCIRAWNAHRSGEATTLQYRAADPLPNVSK